MSSTDTHADSSSLRSNVAGSSLTISVVIPAYNVSTFVCEAIESVWAQHTRPIEIIVVDDASTDSTPDIVERIAEREPDIPLTLIKSSRNLGVSAARNRGVDAAQGNVIAFLDPDDIWLPHHLTAGRKAMESGADLAFGWLEEFGDIEMVSPQLIRPSRWERINWPKGYFRRQYIYPSSMLLRRAVFTSLGGFPTDVTIGEDWILAVRAVMEGFRVQEIKQVTARLRKHRNSATARKLESTQRGLEDSTLLLKEYPSIRRYRVAEYHRQMGYWLALSEPWTSLQHFGRAIVLDPLRLVLWIRAGLALLVGLKLGALIPRKLRFLNS